MYTYTPQYIKTLIPKAIDRVEDYRIVPSINTRLFINTMSIQIVYKFFQVSYHQKLFKSLKG